MKIYKVLSNDSSHMFILGADNANELKYERVQNATDVFNKACQCYTIYARFEKKVNDKKICIAYNYARGTNGTKTIKYVYLNNVLIKKFDFNDIDIHDLITAFTRLDEHGYECIGSVINQWFTWEN